MDWKLAGRAVFWGLIGGLTALQTAGGLPKDEAGVKKQLGAQMGVFYLLGFLRMNIAFAKPPARLTDDEKRELMGLPPKRPNV